MLIETVKTRDKMLSNPLYTEILQSLWRMTVFRYQSQNPLTLVIFFRRNGRPLYCILAAFYDLMENNILDYESLTPKFLKRVRFTHSLPANCIPFVIVDECTLGSAVLQCQELPVGPSLLTSQSAKETHWQIEGRGPIWTFTHPKVRQKSYRYSLYLRKWNFLTKVNFTTIYFCLT